MHDLVEPVGEAWLTGLDCQIATGPFAGKTLARAWPKMDAPWRGLDFEGESYFPLLLKFIFPKDKLSIQVHPDHAYAAAHERAAGGRGKTEMWHVVSAEPGAHLLAGLESGTTKEKFRAALAAHTLEQLFQSHEVHPGDTFFIPAGTPHTIGPDMVVCEVQEYSDLTYRVYDYGRVDLDGKARELHVEKALAVIDFQAGRVEKVEAKSILRRDGFSWDRLVSCKYFDTIKLSTAGPFHVKTIRKPPKEFQLWAFMQGSGKVDWSTHPHDFCGVNSGQFSYRPGECWFMPAVFGGHSVLAASPTSILMATPHNLKLDAKQSGDAS